MAACASMAVSRALIATRCRPGPAAAPLLLLPPRGGAETTIMAPRRRRRRIMADCPRLGGGDDLAPTPASERTMTALDLAALWAGLVVGVPAYYLAGSLVELGMSAAQGVATVSLANLVVLATLVLGAAPATQHGLPFPVLARAAFGVRGAHVPAAARALLGCGWFGIESWAGARAAALLLPDSLPPAPLQLACLLCFTAAQLAALSAGMPGIRRLEKHAAPVLVSLTAALLAWAFFSCSSAGGPGFFWAVLSQPSRLAGPDLWAVFFPALTANVSFWSTVSISIPDFARYARSQADQIMGQAGLPLFMGLFTLAGLLITSSTQPIFGRVVSDPIDLLSQISRLSPWPAATKVLAVAGVSLAIITTNVAANVVAPANALVALFPGALSFTTAAMAAAALGVAMQPWRLLGSSESFVFTWLLGNAALMGPIAGVSLADHYLVRRTRLDVAALYSEEPGGEYYFQGGFNVAAMVAMAAGFAAVLPGFLHKVGVLASVHTALVVAYNNAWFVSFFVAGGFYCLLRSPAVAGIRAELACSAA